MRNPIVAYIAGTLAGFVFGCLFRFDAYIAKDRGSGTLNDPNAGNLNQRLIYVVTPTYARPQQKAELTRLSYALRLAGNVHWVLVEDSSEPTELVSNLVKLSGLQYTQLHVETPPVYKLKTKDPSWLKPRGVLQRNAALHFLRTKTPAADDSVVYFADDDNTYDVKLFEEMRLTQKASVWPVGLVGGLLVERPIVVDGRIKRFNAVFRPDRPYPIDMAAFAVSLNLLKSHPDAVFSLNVQRGYQESHFLTQFLKNVGELEPRADSCTKVLVWHTRTENADLKHEKRLLMPSNHGIEV